MIPTYCVETNEGQRRVTYVAPCGLLMPQHKEPFIIFPTAKKRFGSGGGRMRSIAYDEACPEKAHNE